MTEPFCSRLVEMIGHLGSCFAVSTISPELAFLAGGGKLADIISTFD
jgi:hypothetical protein